MSNDLIFNICGIVASVGMVLGYLPQAIETIRTRNTDGIALIHKPDIIWSLFLTNLITSTCSSIVFGIKIYNDYFKKKKDKTLKEC